MRLDEFDNNVLKAKMQALIDDPNADENIKQVARNKLQALLDKEAAEEEKSKQTAGQPQPMKFNDFGKKQTQGTYNAKGEFKPWNVGKSEFKPMSMSSFAKKA